MENRQYGGYGDYDTRPISVTKERPLRGSKQVMSPQDIQPGDRLRRHYCLDNDPCKPQAEEFSALKAPFRDQNGKWRLEIATSRGYTFISFLSDCGVVPYENGFWAIHK